MKLFKHLTTRSSVAATWVALMLCVGAPVVQARQPAGTNQTATEELVSTITTDQMKTIMQGEGYVVEKTPGGNLLWKIDGLKTVVSTAADGKSVLFYACVQGSNATLKTLNEWNRTKKYSRTYLDSDGDACLESDLVIAGGVTPARMLDFLKTCRMSFQLWCIELVK
jgi:hypothetical protein